MAAKKMSEETKAALRAKRTPLEKTLYLDMAGLSAALDKLLEDGTLGGSTWESVVNPTEDLVFPDNMGIPSRRAGGGGRFAEPKGGVCAWGVYCAERTEERPPERIEDCGLCRVVGAAPELLGFLCSLLPHRWILRQVAVGVELEPVFPYRVLYHALKGIGMQNPDAVLKGGAKRLIRAARRGSGTPHPKPICGFGQTLAHGDRGAPFVVGTVREAVFGMVHANPRRRLFAKALEKLLRIIRAAGERVLDPDPTDWADYSLETLASVQLKGAALSPTPIHSAPDMWATPGFTG